MHWLRLLKGAFLSHSVSVALVNRMPAAAANRHSPLAQAGACNMFGRQLRAIIRARSLAVGTMIVLATVQDAAADWARQELEA
jgi:hypothetical protein